MKEPRISLISAIAKKNRAIGKDNALLWHIPEDFKHFKDLTSGHAIVMGENTYRSIGRPLPNRTNIVLSLTPSFAPEGCVVVQSIDEALAKAREAEQEEIFIIGGASIYKQFIPMADRLYLTLVEGEYEADTFFPEYDDFTRIVSETSMDNGTYRFSFVTLERNIGMEKKIILGVTGEMASGKDTVTKYLVEKYGAKQFRFSDVLRDILDRLHLPQVRKNLAGLSHALRKAFGEDILAHVIENDAKRENHALVVIDGIRRVSDIDLVKKLPEFTLIYVEADMQRRYERLIGRRQNADDQTKTFEEFKQDHLLETEITIPPLRVDAQYIVNNDGTLEELYAQTDRIITELQNIKD